MPCTTPHDFTIPSTKFRLSSPIVPKGSLCGKSKPIPVSFYNYSNKCHFEVLIGEVPSIDKFKLQKEEARKERIRQNMKVECCEKI